MSYAQALKSFSNPVDRMFGLVSRKGVMRAIEAAREEARLERVANHDTDMAEFAVLVKRMAKGASRPTSTSTKSGRPTPLVP